MTPFPTRRAAAGGTVVAALLVAVVLAVGSAGALHETVEDPKDTKGLLDVRRVRLDHAKVPHTVRIVTFRTWTPARIWDRGYLFVYLDVRFGPDPEHYILVRSVGNRMVGTLHRIRARGPDLDLGSVKVWRPSGASVAVNVPLGRLAFTEQRRFYRWWVVSTLIDGPCPNGCIDRVPNSGTLMQDRPGVAPSPPPSPSPSPSP